MFLIKFSEGVKALLTATSACYSLAWFSQWGPLAKFSHPLWWRNVFLLFCHKFMNSHDSILQKNVFGFELFHMVWLSNYDIYGFLSPNFDHKETQDVPGFANQCVASLHFLSTPYLLLPCLGSHHAIVKQIKFWRMNKPLESSKGLLYFSLCANAESDSKLNAWL